MYIDTLGSDSLMDMETDGPVLDDVNMLKKAVEEEATQVNGSSGEGAVTATKTVDSDLEMELQVTEKPQALNPIA